MSVVMILGESLDGAAAWANILALPVAIAGVILTLRKLDGEQVESGAQDREAPGQSMSLESDVRRVAQIGFAGRDQINVGRDYHAPRSDGR